LQVACALLATDFLPFYDSNFNEGWKFDGSLIGWKKTRRRK
jgi:hypothetical protein